ncbi:HD domain-containing protein, partial [Sulfuricurvum sp.]|uniref:HD domain-containing protein n=1 Tax=Sulfuricurvum sp. TaxID=2025608 RepID=UPI00263706B9
MNKILNPHENGLKEAKSFANIMGIIGGLSIVASIYLDNTGEALTEPYVWFNYASSHINQIQLGVGLIAIGALAVYIMNFSIYKVKNKIPKTITLEELSKIWISEEERERLQKEKEANEFNPQIEEKQNLRQRYEFIKQGTSIFLDNYVDQYIEIIHLDDLRIIYELLEFLEEEGGISSVTGYKGDPETAQLLEDKFAEKSSFEISKMYSLYDHSLRVARYCCDNLEKKAFDKYSWQTKIGMSLILGLSHDIGKVRTAYHSDKSTIRAHAIESKSLFLEMFLNYEHAEQVAELILNHHMSRSDLGNMGKMLVQADKDARKEETLLWQKDQHRIDSYFVNIDGTIDECRIFSEEIIMHEVTEKFKKTLNLDLFGASDKLFDTDIAPIPFDFMSIETGLILEIMEVLNTNIKGSFTPACASVKNKIIINITIFKQIVQRLLYLEDDQ